MKKWIILLLYLLIVGCSYKEVVEENKETAEEKATIVDEKETNEKELNNEEIANVLKEIRDYYGFVLNTKTKSTDITHLD